MIDCGIIFKKECYLMYIIIIKLRESKMAQPNDVKQILDIGNDGVPRKKDHKLKDKKKRPGMHFPPIFSNLHFKF